MAIISKSDPSNAEKYRLWRISLAHDVLERLKKSYDNLTPEQRREIRACLREEL
jgi:hypothetical protein